MPPALEAGPLNWEDLLAAAEKEAISEITLRRARAEKGLEKVRRRNDVLWKLPFRLPPIEEPW